ncbi:cell wall hydrolase [Azospirillum sp. B2RO_4]|uniref:cell wall hydrolase n=1 Tax=Azospirillum sp. B2RO_4 TaxID=3027796 RepID=UPI003DA9E112
MRNLLPALMFATAVMPAAAGAQVIDASDAACRPGDSGCARFVGDVKGNLPKRGGAKQPVVIGASVYMLTPWQAERERRCLALAGWAEARGEGADAMAAVMWVVANRAASADRPSLPCRVIVAAGQFEPFAVPSVEPKARRKPGKSEKPVADPRIEARRILSEIRRQARVIRAGGMPSWPKPRLAPDQDALRIARGLAWRLNDDDLPDPTARASLFYSPPTQTALRRQKPDWAEARLHTTSIGGHAFYRYPAPPADAPAETPADPIATLVAEISE